MMKLEEEIIGSCTLHHADCREIFPNIPDNSVDFIFTDPPYGHNNNNGDLIHNKEKALGCPAKNNSNEPRPIEQDSPEEVAVLIPAVFKECARILKPGAVICCCCSGGGGPDPQFARWSLLLDDVLEFKQMVVWDKGPMGMGWHYRRSYEVVLVAMKKGAACKWYDETSKVENIIRPGYKGIKKIIPQASDHPTMKPIELASHFIQLHSAKGDLVFDPFMGFAGTGLACINLNRKFIGVEVNERFFLTASERINNLNRQTQLDFEVA